MIVTNDHSRGKLRSSIGRARDCDVTIISGQDLAPPPPTDAIEAVADAVAADLGIDTVFAEVLPGDKVDKIRELKDQGKRVAPIICSSEEGWITTSRERATTSS